MSSTICMAYKEVVISFLLINQSYNAPQVLLLFSAMWSRLYIRGKWINRFQSVTAEPVKTCLSRTDDHIKIMLLLWLTWFVLLFLKHTHRLGQRTEIIRNHRKRILIRLGLFMWTTNLMFVYNTSTMFKKKRGGTRLTDSTEGRHNFRPLK